MRKVEAEMGKEAGNSRRDNRMRKPTASARHITMAVGITTVDVYKRQQIQSPLIRVANHSVVPVKLEISQVPEIKKEDLVYAPKVGAGP